MVLRFFHNNLFVINQNSQIIVPFEKFCKLEKLILLLFGGQVKRKFFFSKTDKCTLIGAPEFVSVSNLGLVVLMLTIAGTDTGEVMIH